MKKISVNLLDPSHSAREAHIYKGFLAINKLSRLMEVVTSDMGYIKAEASFSFIQNNIASIKLEVLAEIELCCQRTLKPFMFNIKSNSLLAIVESEKQMDYLPDEYEAVVMDEGLIKLYEIIEEEILLSIPIIPKAPLKDCQFSNNQAYCSASKNLEEQSDDIVKLNPFAVLKGLKDKKD